MDIVITKMQVTLVSPYWSLILDNEDEISFLLKNFIEILKRTRVIELNKDHELESIKYLLCWGTVFNCNVNTLLSDITRMTNVQAYSLLKEMDFFGLFTDEIPDIRRDWQLLHYNSLDKTKIVTNSSMHCQMLNDNSIYIPIVYKENNSLFFEFYNIIERKYDMNLRYIIEIDRFVKICRESLDNNKEKNRYSSDIIRMVNGSFILNIIDNKLTEIIYYHEYLRQDWVYGNIMPLVIIDIEKNMGIIHIKIDRPDISTYYTSKKSADTRHFTLKLCHMITESNSYTLFQIWYPNTYGEMIYEKKCFNDFWDIGILSIEKQIYITFRNETLIVIQSLLSI